MAYERVEESEFAKVSKLLVAAERCGAHRKTVERLRSRLEFLARGKAERYAQFADTREKESK